MYHFICHRMDTRCILHWDNILLDSCLVDTAIDHNYIQSIMVLQNGNILQWIPINYKTVRIVTLFDLAHFVRAHE